MCVRERELLLLFLLPLFVFWLLLPMLLLLLLTPLQMILLPLLLLLLHAVVYAAATALVPIANSDAASVAADDVGTHVATPVFVATASDAIRDVPAPKPLTQQLSLPL